MRADVASTGPERTPYQSGWLADDGSDLPSPGGTVLACRGVALAGLRTNARLVDIGCGSGNAADRLRRSLGFEAIGLDRAPARGHLGIPRLRAAGEHLPFTSGTLDGVLLQCTLSVVSDQERVLAECSRVLVHGGKLVIADLYARNPAAVDQLRAVPATCLSRILVREELSNRLAAHGFAVEIWEDHSNLLRDFLFDFVMKRGPVERLWGGEEGERPEAERIGVVLKDLRPGYCLVVAARAGR